MGNGSSDKERNELPKARRSISGAFHEEKASHLEGKNVAQNDLVSNETATKNPCIIASHVPNAETAKVLREAREGKNLLRYKSLEEMFKDLGI